MLIKIPLLWKLLILWVTAQFSLCCLFVENWYAIDKYLNGRCAKCERMGIPEDDVGVVACPEVANSMIQPEGFCGDTCYGGDGLWVWEAVVVAYLGFIKKMLGVEDWVVGFVGYGDIVLRENFSSPRVGLVS